MGSIYDRFNPSRRAFIRMENARPGPDAVCNLSYHPYNLIMIQFWSIAKNTFVQTIRQPIFGVMIFMMFVVLVISLPLSGWTMGTDYATTDQRMLENVGLSTLLLMGMLTAAFCASNALNREIEDKTALTVISKPVPRGVFVLGKYAGVAMAVSLAFYLGSLVFLMTVRHRVVSTASTPYDWPVIIIGLAALAIGLLLAGAGNYVFGWTFISAAVISLLISLTVAMGLISIIAKGWRIIPFTETFSDENIRPQLLIGLFLIYQAVLILSAVAVAASTRLGQILTLLVCFAVLVGGSMYPWLIDKLTERWPVAEPLGWVLPNLTSFYPMDWLSNNWDIPLSLVALTTAYFACYGLGVLGLGIAMFQTRPLEAQTSSSSMPGAVALLSGLGRITAVALGVLAVLRLTIWEYYNLRWLITIALLLVAAGAGWIIWSAFGVGKKWAWWTSTVAAGAAGLWGAMAMWAPWASFLRLGAPEAQFLAMTILSGIVLLTLLLPKTRHHFKSL